MCNVDYKVYGKTLINRLQSVITRLVGEHAEFRTEIFKSMCKLLVAFYRNLESYKRSGRKDSNRPTEDV